MYSVPFDADVNNKLQGRSVNNKFFSKGTVLIEQFKVHHAMREMGNINFQGIFRPVPCMAGMIKYFSKLIQDDNFIMVFRPLTANE